MFSRIVLVLVAATGVVFSALPGCTDRGHRPGQRFRVWNTMESVRPGSPVEVREPWILYLADERTTGGSDQDLNGDGDAEDQVAFVFNMKDASSTNIGVAAQAVHLAGSRLYVVVPEDEDAFDWNADGDFEDTVLVHAAKDTLVLVDTIDTGPGIVSLATDSRVYFCSATIDAPTATTLAYVDSRDPLHAVPVAAADGVSYRPRILGIDDGLLFTYLDETVEQTDLNGDGDAGDGFVIALHDTVSSGAPLIPTGLAARDDQVPRRARRRGSRDWLVGFLVSEAAHGDLTGGGFNDPAMFENTDWQPTQCEGDEDADLEDDVLHYLFFAAWFGDPIANPPMNTGLVGTRRVVALVDPIPYVGTVSRETDEGGCDLNADRDTDDEVVRWVEAAEPIRPFRSARELVATIDVSGASRGVGELDDVLVAVVSEAAHEIDYDLDGKLESDLLGWMRPRDGVRASWSFFHRLDKNGTVEGGELVKEDTPDGSDWMEESPGRDFVFSSFQESVYGRKINGDSDLTDAMPIWGRVSSDRIDLHWDTMATEPGKAGLVLAGGRVFYRASESASDKDGNGDGDKFDMIVVTVPQSGGRRQILGTVIDEPAAAVITDPRGASIGAAFVADERMEDEDLNGDGDFRDFVIRWFRF
jgi:hypothetical protein